MQRRDDAEFTAYVTSRQQVLRRTAFLLSGDWHSADDLVQTALIRLYVAWPRVYRGDSVDAYARRVLMRVYLDEKRRPWRRERPVDSPPEPTGVDDQRLGVDVVRRDRLITALLAVPDRQRAVLVLRYFNDLSVEQVADALSCSAGTVKSQALRGLARLRGELGPAFLAEETNR